MKNLREKPSSIAQAIRLFVGTLERQGLAHHTIRSYKSDLATFEKYCDELGGKFGIIDQGFILGYRNEISRRRYKKNTVRRKILTLQQFLEFSHQNQWVRLGQNLNLSVPAKILRVPATIDLFTLRATLLERFSPCKTQRKTVRSLLLLWIASEAGLRTSELIAVKKEDAVQGQLKVQGKYFRVVRISGELQKAIQDQKSGNLFLGYNRFGPISEKLTQRGAEMLIRTETEKVGLVGVTARTLRNSLIREWIAEGRPESEIVRDLGIKKLPEAIQIH